MFNNKGIAFTFISIVSLITMALMGLLAVVITSTANTSQTGLTTSIIEVLKTEGKQEEKLLKQGLLAKGDSIANLLAQTGASLILGYDFDTLQQLANSAQKDQDISSVVFYDLEQKPLTKVSDAKDDVPVVEKAVLFEGETIGQVKVFLNYASVNATISKQEERIGSLVTDSEESLNASSHTLVTRIALFAVVGVLILCGVIFFCLRMFVIRPITLIINNLHEGAAHLSLTSNQMLTASHHLADGSSKQAAAIEETSSSLEEMSSMTRNNAENAHQGNSFMAEVKEVVSKANESMAKQTVSMGEITKASEETSKIIKTIDEIAFQTNLLALNAAVEAARAGEAGAGFAVVADEVRNLAARAAQAASNTASLIEGIIKKINDGAKLVTQTNQDFGEVAEGSEKIGQLISEIATSSREQAEGIAQINKAIDEIDKVTQNNAAHAEETSSASEELNSQAGKIATIVVELQHLVGGGSQNREQLHVTKDDDAIAAGREKALDSHRRQRPALPAHFPGSKRKDEDVMPSDDDSFSDF